jgi:hypothetical protein
MELVSPRDDPTTGSQVCTLFEPLQMALPGMHIGILLLHKPFKRLRQQAGYRSLPFHSEQLDLEKNLFGNRERNILSFHCCLHVN